MSYMDDLLSVQVLSKAYDSFNATRHLLDDLNIPISEAKLTRPTTKLFVWE